jgi:hypothetical protein
MTILYLFGDKTRVDDTGKETEFLFGISIGDEEVLYCDAFMK